MNPIRVSALACPNWCIATIIAKAFQLGYDKRGITHLAGKISRPDQEKGG